VAWYTPGDVTAVGDRVLVDLRRTGRGEASGAQVDERQFHVWDVVAGRAVRFRVYLDRNQALEAVGLGE
jgi:ketosteroid isomerase-like protein